MTPFDLSGLVRESHLMIDKIATVRRANIQSRVGRLTAGQLVDVERAMLVFLGGCCAACRLMPAASPASAQEGPPQKTDFIVS
ncbi:hypothetical protein [Arthrobacter methylotrophus]|uniref:Uncharacterized protein n=1 Tax=Arthrobacter methylotrophus TaxID=121291 RepID=A0ABV5UKV3_9MICC